MTPSPNIAIASSGLGHVARGIETWALDTAVALAARGQKVTLFAGGPVTLPQTQAPLPEVIELPCLTRFASVTRGLVRVTPGVSWRWGLKDGYGWEQVTFWLALKEHLRQRRCNILHVQDPMLARWCLRWRTRGRLQTREILAHGTEESPDFLATFPRVQHLAPWHLVQTLAALKAAGDATPRPHWTAIPNFVDTSVFSPAANSSARAAARATLNLPDGDPLIGCVAAIKKHHKRIDVLIREFAEFTRTPVGNKAQLVIAGANHPDAEELQALAQSSAPGRIHIRMDVARADMPRFYQALDVFVLPSLFEMMPIALLEALACGVPVLVHRHPVLTWIAGAGGATRDLEPPGALARALGELGADWRALASIAARAQAEREFAREAVIDRYIAYYGQVLA